MRHLRHALGLLHNAGVTIRLHKCHLFQESVDYLGHDIRPGQLHVASKTVDDVQGFNPPRSKTDVRSFLGLCNVFRRFIKGFARIETPLNDLLCKGSPERFPPITGDKMTAFGELKERLTSRFRKSTANPLSTPTPATDESDEFSYNYRTTIVRNCSFQIKLIIRVDTNCSKQKLAVFTLLLGFEPKSLLFPNRLFMLIRNLHFITVELTLMTLFELPDGDSTLTVVVARLVTHNIRSVILVVEYPYG